MGFVKRLLGKSERRLAEKFQGYVEITARVTYSYLLPLTSRTLPLYDKICVRFLNFARLLALIMIRPCYDLPPYTEFIMPKPCRSSVKKYAFVRRDLSVLSMF
jgi:hypothetical protein